MESCTKLSTFLEEPKIVYKNFFGNILKNPKTRLNILKISLSIENNNLSNNIMLQVSVISICGLIFLGFQIILKIVLEILIITLSINRSNFLS